MWMDSPAVLIRILLLWLWLLVQFIAMGLAGLYVGYVLVTYDPDGSSNWMYSSMLLLLAIVSSMSDRRHVKFN